MSRPMARSRLDPATVTHSWVPTYDPRGLDPAAVAVSLLWVSKPMRVWVCWPTAGSRPETRVVTNAYQLSLHMSFMLFTFQKKKSLSCCLNRGSWLEFGGFFLNLVDSLVFFWWGFCLIWFWLVLDGGCRRLILNGFLNTCFQILVNCNNLKLASNLIWSHAN